MIGGTPPALLAPAPPERLAALRVLVVGFAVAYLLIRSPHLVDIARLADTNPERFTPVGPLVLFDAPLPMGAGVGLLVGTVASGLVALAGWRWRVTGPLFALGVLVLLSYRNSWGQIFHTENLLVLHLAVLALAPAADAWSLDARRQRGARRPPAASARYGWPAQVMVLVVVAAYLLAGWAKLRASGVGWIEGDALRNLVAHDALRKELVGDHSFGLGVWMLRHDWLFTPMAVAALGVELLAPLALLGGRWKLGWVASAWIFHLGVLAVMGIMFPYQVFGVAFACFVTVESLRIGGRAAAPVPGGANLSS